MALFPAPAPRSQRFDLLCGASRQMYLRGGATVVCVTGSLMLAEPAYRSDVPPGVYLPPPARLHAGESFVLAERGPLTLTALTPAHVICLERPGAMAWIRAIAGCWRGLAHKNNPAGRLGALHNISK
ncbi:MAG: hypothetical protein ACN6O8_02155 [Achromobacter sp.]|uniref:hypothetical protein n=1 Tax=Achromobacter sp. TaxID=134375 RepID=UPI003D049178